MKGKPDYVIEKILQGKLQAFYKQVCLLDQNYVKEPSISVKDHVEAESKKLGKPLTIKRFWRWQIGS